MSSQVFLLCLIAAQCVLLGLIAAMRMQRMEAELRPSLRDQLAIAALPALLHQELGPRGIYQHVCEQSAIQVSVRAYEMADAMLESRK